MQEKLLLLVGNFDCTEMVIPILSDDYELEFAHDLPPTGLVEYAVVLFVQNLQSEADTALVKTLHKHLPTTPLILLAEKACPTLLVELFNENLIKQYIAWPSKAADLTQAIRKLLGETTTLAVYQSTIHEPSNFSANKLSDSQQQSVVETDLHRYRQIVENLEDEYIFYTKDVHNQLTYISPSVHKILGFTQEEWQTRLLQHFTRSAINKKAYKYALQTLSGKQTPVYEIELLDSHGKKRYFEVSEIPIFDKLDRLVAVEGIAHDITQKQETLLKVKQSLSLQTTLSEISAMLNQSDQFEERIHEVLAEIAKQVDVPLIAIVERASNQLIAGIGIAEWQGRLNLDTKKLLEIGQIIITKQEQELIWLTNNQLAAAVIYPLIYQQQVIGFTVVGLPSEDALPDETYAFLRTISHIISQAFQRSKSHLKLLDRVQHFKKLFEQAPFGIIAFTDTNGKAIVNKAFASILGYTIEELAEKSAMQLFLEFTHPEDLELEKAFIDEVIAHERKSYTIKKRYIHKNGATVWVNLSGAFLRQETDGIHMNMIMVQDITEKIKVEQEKEAEQEKLRLILDTLPISVSLKDAEGHYLFFNQRALAYTGRSLNEILGKKSREIFPPRLASVYEAYDLQAKKEESGQVTWFEIKKDTTEGPKQMLVGKKVFYSNTQEHLLNFEVDITTLKKVELDLQRALNRLEQAQNNLEHSEKMSSLGILTAGVAHEINNPVNFIQGGIYILEDYLNPILELLQMYKKLDEPSSAEEEAQVRQSVREMKEELEFDEALVFLKDGVDSIQKGAERTVEIVKVLRNFSRHDESYSHGVDMHEALDATLVLLQNKLKGRIEVIKNYFESLPTIECNEGQINQVFMNLLSNAEQAIADEGTITITTAQPSPMHVEIQITDTGSGMSEAVKQRIFEAFYTTKKVGVGTGLGLSISASIIEKHQGEIKVISEESKGTTFIVRLPVQH